MHVSELLGNIITSILAGFLAFSGFLADGVERGLSALQLSAPIPETLVEGGKLFEDTRNEDERSTNGISHLPSHYEHNGLIPRILLEDPQYQQAAVAASGLTEETPGVETDTRPIPKRLEEAVVNIFCTYRNKEYVRASTGSGVFVDPRGIILTNAHVAQFLLLESTDSETETRCIIRQGNPAEPRYMADLFYIPPAWVRENAAMIDAENPIGTGERDYALLLVSSATQGELPEKFPAIVPDASLLSRKDQSNRVFAAGYPAEIFRTAGTSAELSVIVASTTITELFTFGGNDADLISIAPSTVGERGASGGPVVDAFGSLIGLIVTQGDENDGKGSLRALTIPYISQTIMDETGFDLAATLQGDVFLRAQLFKSALAPFLALLLEDELN